MPEKKKGAKTAPEKPTDSVTQGGAEINAKIVERMVAYSPRDYLSAEDALQWDDVEERRTAINADRNRECAAAGLKPYMPEYNAMWGSVRVSEYTDVIMAQYQLNDVTVKRKRSVSLRRSRESAYAVTNISGHNLRSCP